MLKRSFDFLAATFGLVLLSPLIAIVAALIYVTMGRPVFFAQRRPGQGGRLFTVSKFRTMRAEQGAALSDA